MTAVTLIFPHQLFANHPCIVRGQDVYLIEECLFFKQYRFHQHKLLLHRASMKKYAHLLDQLNVKVNYIDSQKLFERCQEVDPSPGSTKHYQDTVCRCCRLLFNDQNQKLLQHT